MSDYNEEIDEFAPAQQDVIAPVQHENDVSQPGRETPENESGQPEIANPYDSIITQQNEQIAALIAQNENLTNQITKLIKNGAQITGTTGYKADPLANINGVSLADNEDWSLEALAKDIGKRRH